MEKAMVVFLVVISLALPSGVRLQAQNVKPAGAQGVQESHLAVVWTSGDPEVAHRACLMYCHAAAGLRERAARLTPQ